MMILRIPEIENLKTLCVQGCTPKEEKATIVLTPEQSQQYEELINEYKNSK